MTIVEKSSNKESEEQTSNVLQPGAVIRPVLSLDTAIVIIEKLYGLKAIKLKEYISYDDRNFFFRVDLESGIRNPYLTPDEICPDGYMLKVTNSLDSKDGDFFMAQNEMILHLASKGMEVPVPIKNVHGTYQSLESLLDDSAASDSWTVNNVGDSPNGKFMVRALKFVPGKTLYDISPWTIDHFLQLGKFTAEVDIALRDFSHPGFRTRDSIWFLSSVPRLVDFVHAIKDDENRKMILDIIDTFSREVISIQDQLEKSVIHGDLNEQNLLLRPKKDGEGFEIFSMIDFGDSQFNALIYELALSIMYMMTNCTEIHPNLVGGYVLAGYLPLRKLPEQEMDILRTCVAARYAQSLTMGAYTYEQDPSNTYVLTTAKTGWTKLTEFWKMPKTELYEKWEEIIASHQNDKN